MRKEALHRVSALLARCIKSLSDFDQRLSSSGSVSHKRTLDAAREIVGNRLSDTRMTARFALEKRSVAYGLRRQDYRK